MTDVAGASKDGSGNRVYVIQGRPMPSASNVLGKLHRPGIEGFKWKAIASGLAHDPTLLNMARAGSTWKAAKAAIDASSTDKADIGTAVHLATETFDRTGSVDEAMYALEIEVGTWSKQRRDYIHTPAIREHLLRWVETRDAFGIVPSIIELTVCHAQVGYAGTMDRAVEFEDEHVADLFHAGCRLAHTLDVKTGEKVYPEVGLQLAGYANATHSWNYRDDSVTSLRDLCNEVGIVASLHADACRLYPVDLTAAWGVFSAASLAWRWSEIDAHEAVGQVIPSPASVTPW